MITQQEAQTILTLLSVEYPENYRNLSEMEVKLHIGRLCKNYEQLEFPQVYAAYEACIRKCKFAPKTADIFEFLRGQVCDKLEAAEARKAILKAVSNGTYGAAEEYENLPAELKEVMTSYDIREMAILDTRDLDFHINSILKQLAEKQKVADDYALLSDKGREAFADKSTKVLAVASEKQTTEAAN